MIRNETKHKILARKILIYRSLLSKATGLMFSSKRSFSDAGAVFIFNIEKNLSFHTCFMNFSLDFLFLDSERKVTKIIRDVKPWRIALRGRGMYVVELNAGSSKNTSVGDRISFK